MVAWARASFEQGALPSLLFLQGLVPIFTLPGDKMFQSTGICQGRQRPPIMHAYGRAKIGMAQALRLIASEGWIPLAAAMVGTTGKKPMWADFGLRPVVGTTVDIKISPYPLEHRELVLLLSCWKRWDHRSVPGSAINTWLVDVDLAAGPDCEDSPHFKRVDIDCFEAIRLLEESGFGFLPESELQNQPILETVMSVGLRLCALEFSAKQLNILSYLTMSGLLPETFPHEKWVLAVQRSFLTQEAAVCRSRSDRDEVRQILELVQTATVTVESSCGTTLWTKDSVCLPMPQDEEFPLRLLVHPTTRDQSHLPEVVHVEATGLGGRDLGYPEKWDISIRSDPEGQNVYGPSLATVEDTVVEPNGTGGTVTKQVTALGLSKATQEFLTLHYELFPDARFPGAVVRRAVAVKVFDNCHIAPSHRRYPHPVCVDSFCLIADLLLGCGVGRYLGSLQGPAFQQEVALRGFSAGSYSGLCLLHILWPIPGVATRGCLGAIACPPSLLKMNLAKDGDRLHLIHYESDELCCWKPGRQQLEQSCSKFTYIMNESSAYKGHFGPSEHGYSHWLGLDLPHGMMQLSTLLFLRPEAAAKAKRDATPLRLQLLSGC